jgi:hypothetical protein
VHPETDAHAQRHAAAEWSSIHSLQRPLFCAGTGSATEAVWNADAEVDGGAAKAAGGTRCSI